MKKTLIAFFFLIVLFCLLSYFEFGKPHTQKTDPKQDFLALTSAPPEIQTILKKSCYDCHSLVSVYPTYSTIFPISLLIYHHIDEGRLHANFSLWDSYNKESKKHILEEAIEEIENNKMPMSSYILVHDEARLSTQEKNILLEWLKMQVEKN